MFEFLVVWNAASQGRSMVVELLQSEELRNS